MVSGINTEVSSLQLLRATQAFKKAINSSPKLNSILDEAQTPDIEDKVSVNSINKESQTGITTNNKLETAPVKDNALINDIKGYANKYGYTEVTDEDINYALRYGRSVLVNQTA